MSKIDKQTLKILPRTKISVYKFVNQNTYFCRFFVGRKYFKSGRFEKTCKTRNINEAIVKANQYYKDWFIQHATDTIEKERDFDLDIAQPFINFRIRKYQNKTHLKNNEQGERDKSKYNYLKPFFENVDYKDLDLVEDVINNDVLSKLKDDGKSGSTINKYLSLITQMFKRALTRGIVNYVPDTPTQQVINTPRYPYENSDLNLINGRCREEYKKTNDIFFLESKDYFNLLRSAGFRPGLEPLSLKRKDFEFISSPNNPDEKFLKFTIWGTKTKPIHNPIANPYFSEKVFPEILNRHSNLSDNDYLLFPFQKDRTRLKQSTGKLFVRFSKDLNLYFHKGGTRPLYAIRHTYATELYKKGTSIDDIAQLMNTSARMIIGVYLGHTNQALINLIKRVPTNLKIIK
jgi:integrase